MSPTDASPAPAAAVPEDAAPPSRAAITARLAAVRERTLAMLAPLTEQQARTQHDPLLSPIVWDLGHIAAFEALWLGRNLEGPIEFSELPGLYNPFEHPRRTRGALPLPTLAEQRAALARGREATLARLERVDLGGAHPLLAAGYVYEMVAQHEEQHQETIWQTLMRMGDYDGTWFRLVAAPAARPLHEEILAPAPAAREGTVTFPGGLVAIGTDDARCAYDNERPAHLVELAPFAIDVDPVTVGAYHEFVLDGGYTRRALWTDEGWAWRVEHDAEAPMYWERHGGEWHVRRLDRPLAHWTELAAHPVLHVCCHEAEAYARWAGARLPTEAEWETACRFDPATGAMRAYPWGEDAPTMHHAVLDQLPLGTAPVGSRPANRSPLGCRDLIGGAWEWTASAFDGYPGFRAFPYAEYSETFFGSEYRVLRGSSWATRPGVARSTFRNWDYPIRRQLFSGFRCARDA